MANDGRHRQRALLDHLGHCLLISTYLFDSGENVAKETLL